MAGRINRLSTGALLAIIGTGIAASPAGAQTLVAGAVNANGTVQGSPTSFSVTHPSTGRYVITFTTAFSPYPQCIFQGIGGPVRVAGLTSSATVCDVTFATIVKRTKTIDTLFNFIAAPQSP